MYLVGEALIGKHPELAHVDLLVGDKEGPVGQAFATGLASLSVGHTPLLAVIRPNLPTKPATLIVPKVTVKNMDQAARIFGPAQAAVAKAVADSAEAGIIPEDQLDKIVVICSVFVHPEAKDFRKIYHYNYGATRLALQRAFSCYPSSEKLFFDKDRATHPMMGFKVPRLWNPPYLQVALDVPDLQRTKDIISKLPRSDRIILEAGTPLIKKYGTRIIQELRSVAQDVFIIADLKTLDVGQVEVDLAYDETADAAVVSGLASKDTLERFIHEAERLSMYSFIDTMGMHDPVQTLSSLRQPPDAIIIHRGIDEESRKERGWDIIRALKDTFPRKKLLVGVAGGIQPSNIDEALKAGADILIVGRYITQSRDVERSARDFLEHVGLDTDLYRVHVE
jgi:bifunctional enzyme Fae/Hps